MKGIRIKLIYMYLTRDYFDAHIRYLFWSEIFLFSLIMMLSLDKVLLVRRRRMNRPSSGGSSALTQNFIQSIQLALNF